MDWSRQGIAPAVLFFVVALRTRVVVETPHLLCGGVQLVYST